jgi:transcriptional regulator with XRE-family HTH domain
VSIFGDRIRELRHISRLKQADFQRYGISQSQLSLIENGETEPCLERIELISRVLERTPAELVAGTELEAQYASAWTTRVEGASGEAAAAFSRSERIVAVEEAYKRVQRFFDLLLDPITNYRREAENERYYQYGARILRRALDAARGFDPSLGTRVYVPDSIMDAAVANGALQFAMTKSLLYIQSLLLEFPEADSAVTRSAVVARIGLAAVDEHLASVRHAPPRLSSVDGHVRH